MRRFVTIMAALGALSLTARSEWNQLSGQAAPEFSAEVWFNTGRYVPTASDLRGKVYLLEFFATW